MSKSLFQPTFSKSSWAQFPNEWKTFFEEFLLPCSMVVGKLRSNLCLLQRKCLKSLQACENNLVLCSTRAKCICCVRQCVNSCNFLCDAKESSVLQADNSQWDISWIDSRQSFIFHKTLHSRVESNVTSNQTTNCTLVLESHLSHISYLEQL